MMLTRTVALVFALVCLAGMGNAFGDEGEDKLFINLTSNEMYRASMAIKFATDVRKGKQIPVTIFLNVDGVKLANKAVQDEGSDDAKSLQDMLKAFMQDGGEVIICPMCMQKVGGMTADDLLDGIQVGGPTVTWPRLFADDTTVLSY